MSRRKLSRYEHRTGDHRIEGSVCLKIEEEEKTFISADHLNDTGGPVEGPGERGGLEGGRGGEQASGAGLLVNNDIIF